MAKKRKTSGTSGSDEALLGLTILFLLGIIIEYHVEIIASIVLLFLICIFLYALFFLARFCYRRAQGRSVGLNANIFDPENYPYDGLEFEHWVASGMQYFGWTAWVTNASGDQGIDVIAEMNGKRLGIQCKRSAKTIGNRAVQEVYSAKRLHKCDFVAVLSNADFTKSAIDLARANNVKLFKHTDIPKILSHFFR